MPDRHTVLIVDDDPPIREMLSDFLQEEGYDTLVANDGASALQTLRQSAEQINLGAVVRATEGDFELVECFNAELNTCRLSSHCHLKNVLGRAMQGYLAVLDGVTLADLVPPVTAPATGAKPLRFMPGIPEPG